MPPRAWLCLLMIGLARSARAEVRHAGKLEWRYDDITVRTSEGKRRTSGWTQVYDFSLSGPLGTPLIGEGSSAVSFNKGKSLAQTVAAADADQKFLGYSFNASLLPPALRQFITAAPSFSKTRTTQSWGEPRASRDLEDTASGVTLGLALPRLPSVSWTRTRLRSRDLSSAASVDQLAKGESAQAAYARGPFRADYRRDRRTVDDRLVPGAGSRSDLTAASGELNFSDLKGRVQRAFLRATYQSQESGPPGPPQRDESETVSLALASRTLRSGNWDSHLGYAHDYSHSTALTKDLLRNSLTFAVSGNLPRVRIDDQLNYLRTDGRARQDMVNKSLSAQWRSPSGRTAYQSSAGGNWTKDEAAGSTVGDFLRHRATVTPRESFDVYGEASTSGSQPLGGRSGGVRQHGAGTGLSMRPASFLQASANYAYTQSRSLAGGPKTASHAVNGQAQATPLDALRAALTYGLTWSRYGDAEYRNSILNVSVTWDPIPELHLSSDFTRADHALNEVVTASYTVGQTRLSLRWEEQQLYSVNAYTRTSVSLSRLF